MNNQETLKALQALKQGIADAEQHLTLLGQLALKLELCMMVDKNPTPIRTVAEVEEITKGLPKNAEELLVDIGNTQENTPAEILLEKSHVEKGEAMEMGSVKEEHANGENLNEKLGKTRTQSTPAQQFEGGNLDDLKKAIPLNLKLAFIKHVFGEDADAYNKAIEYLNTCGHDEAKKFTAQIQLKESGHETFELFKSLLGRRWV
ncbi:MAG: hypothetical protein EXR21_07050 [Flavobacteriaceae bacterium]|nr:hypothetical protein [Flavobacteriaceae bacterium]